MRKTQTLKAVNHEYDCVQYPVTDYRDPVAEAAAVDAGYLSLAEWIKLSEARKAAA